MTKEITYNEALEKLVNIADALDKDKNELTEEMTEIITALTKKHEDDPIPNQWVDVWAMSDDIREHAKNNGRAIVNEDLPVHLSLSWRCTVTDKRWTIRIADFKKSAEEGPASDPLSKQKGELLLRCIKSQDGKSALTQSFNSKK